MSDAEMAAMMQKMGLDKKENYTGTTLKAFVGRGLLPDHEAEISKQ
jgi:hypothetical protein